MAVTFAGWQLEVERGPDWLFVRPLPPERIEDGGNLADEVWALMRQHQTHRVVLEMDQVGYLPSMLIGQLIVLLKRVHQLGGVMRLVGVNSECQYAIDLCRLGSPLASYATRAEAVLGRLPSQPR